MPRLQNKVVLITGASSGFGRCSALLFADEGASIVVADVTEQPSAKGFEDDLEHSTVDLIRNKGGQATFIKCDVTKADEVDAAVAAAVKHFGRLDIMFNNAGIYRGGKLMDQFTEADLDVTYNVNVKGTFFGVQSAVRQFRTQDKNSKTGQRGVIVNLVSTAGLRATRTSRSTTSRKVLRLT
jgi:NAD(P)-dependent dehydrogenase (short-subunit alcohol dehydrogenase family)